MVKEYEEDKEYNKDLNKGFKGLINEGINEDFDFDESLNKTCEKRFYNLFIKLYKQFKGKNLKYRKRFQIEELEQFLIKKLGGVTAYQSAGAYQQFYQMIKDKEDKGEIVAIKSSAYNGRQPALKSRWQIVTAPEQGWKDELIFKLSRRLDLSYYIKRPDLQTEKLAARLSELALFLAEKDKREWASREERSLELFAEEKFLSTSEGKKLLSSLKLSLANLKAEKYSQMFVYWNKGTAIKKVLILENHSAFIACKRAIEAGYSIFSFEADTLIYGEGKHIIDSFQFLDELLDSKKKLANIESKFLKTEDDIGNVKNELYNKAGKLENTEYELDHLEELEIKYAGDIDPEGYLIYQSLKEKYPAYNLEILVDYYSQMCIHSFEKAYPLSTKQQKNETILAKICKEFTGKGRPDLAERLKALWIADLRLPQELITFEVLKKA